MSRQGLTALARRVRAVERRSANVVVIALPSRWPEGTDVEAADRAWQDSFDRHLATICNGREPTRADRHQAEYAVWEENFACDDAQG